MYMYTQRLIPRNPDSVCKYICTCMYSILIRKPWSVARMNRAKNPVLDPGHMYTHVSAVFFSANCQSWITKFLRLSSENGTKGINKNIEKPGGSCARISVRRRSIEPRSITLRMRWAVMYAGTGLVRHKMRCCGPERSPGHCGARPWRYFQPRTSHINSRKCGKLCGETG